MKGHPKYSALGKLISTRRKACGIALQSQLAEKVGESQQSVSRWEAGLSRPRPGQLVLLAENLSTDQSLLRRLAGYGAPVEALPDTATISYDQNLPVDALSPESFERFVDHLLRMRHPDANIRRMGKTGHAQDGVDILATFPDR